MRKTNGMEMCYRSAVFNSKLMVHKKRWKQARRLQLEHLHRATLPTSCRQYLACCQTMAISTIQSNVVIILC